MQINQKEVDMKREGQVVYNVIGRKKENKIKKERFINLMNGSKRGSEI